MIHTTAISAPSNKRTVRFVALGVAALAVGAAVVLGRGVVDFESGDSNPSVVSDPGPSRSTERPRNSLSEQELAALREERGLPPNAVINDQGWVGIGLPNSDDILGWIDLDQAPIRVVVPDAKNPSIEILKGYPVILDDDGTQLGVLDNFEIVEGLTPDGGLTDEAVAHLRATNTSSQVNAANLGGQG